MRRFNYVLLLVLITLLPMTTHAQGMQVIGGSDKAKECYRNASMAGALEFIRGLIDPCDYALKYVNLNQTDRASTLANRGIILTREDNFDEALRDFQTAISLNPDAANIYINRGNMFFYEKDFEKAIADYNKALEMDVIDTHVAFLNRGIAYEGLGNGNQAEADFRKALEINPQWLLAEDILARFLARQLESRKAQ